MKIDIALRNSLRLIYRLNARQKKTDELQSDIAQQSMQYQSWLKLFLIRVGSISLTMSL